VDRAFVEYFQSLFSTASPAGIDLSLQGVSMKVTDEMNGQLLRTFTVEEVEFALSEMHPLKALGLDGFSSCFYKCHWATIGREVSRAVLGFLNSGIMDANINPTYLALIPKGSPSTTVADYRPISLCNVLYKFISKVLANHLKQVLPSVIDKC
jgi:hypothetical protein